MNRILAAYLTFFCVSISGAQQVYWTPSSGTFQEGKTNRLQLNFEGCSPEGDVELPDITNLDMRPAGVTRSMNMINGSFSQKIIQQYQVIPSGQGTAVIPSFTVQTDEGPVTVGEARFEIIEGTVGSTGLKSDEVFFSEIKVLDEEVYVGEVFDIRYVMGIRRGYRVNDLSPPTWSPLGLVTTPLDNPKQQEFSYQGNRYVGLVYNLKAMATKAGMLKLPKSRQTVSLVVGRRPGFIFDDEVVESYNVLSNAVELEIKDLPTGAPASFDGAVGNFALESTLVPDAVQVGEPVTWTLRISGNGNWPQGIGLLPRNVSTSFRAIQPDTNKEISEDSPFEGSLSEDIVLIPTQAGDFTMGPVEFSFFNPKSARYETVIVPESTVSVSPLAIAQDNAIDDPIASASATSTGFSIDQLDLDPSGINLLAKPIEIPSEIAQGAYADLPPSGEIPLGKIVWAFIIPIVLWLLIAVLRSFILDPNKYRRNAFDELKKIANAKSVDQDDEKLRSLQLSWREATRKFWSIDQEEPSAQDVKQAVSNQSAAEQAEAWEKLWIGSDRILYGRKKLPIQDWLVDFKDALQAARKPGISLKRFLSAAAWAPSIAFFMALALYPMDADANDASSLYQDGEFAKAEEEWGGQLEEQPENWTVRHNLGLAAAQQEKWGEALAYWISAYLINPHADELKWNLRIAMRNSESYYPVLAKMISGNSVESYAALLSPYEWERVASYAIYGAIGLFMLAVISLYVSKFQRLTLICITIGALALAFVFVANWAHRQYGLLADPAVLAAKQSSSLKSIPTDLEVEQIETTLPEGAIALPLKSFLGWQKVELPNGEQGWARKEVFTPLYGPAKL